MRPGTENHMKIGFAYNLKDSAFSGTDRHAEYETPETLDAITRVLERSGDVIPLPCDALLPEKFVSLRPDMVFNIAEGWGGRDRESFVPVLCSMLGIPCTGSDAVSLGITMDKPLTKRIARDAGVAVSDFIVCDAVPSEPPPFGFPAFVKPARDGSSRGVFRDSLVVGMDGYREKTGAIIGEYLQPAIVEPYLDGRDFCVGLLGNDPPSVLPTCEVLLGHEDGIPFFSHEYKRRDTDRLDMSPALPADMLDRMERSAIALWNVMGLRDYARFDFRSDAAGSPFLLEINALPGLSPVSGIFVRQAVAAGIPFEALIMKIMERSLRLFGI